MDFHRINTQGKIWLQRVDDVSLIGHIASDEGRMVYSRSDEKIYIATSTEWLELSTEFSVLTAGTTLLFGAYPLPTGWNITNYNDVIVSITDSSDSIGSFAGGWTITGFGNAGSHDHGGTTTQPDSLYISTAADNPDYVLDNQYVDRYHTHSLIGDGDHSHSFNGIWRPSNIKFCEAVLQ